MLLKNKHKDLNMKKLKKKLKKMKKRKMQVKDTASKENNISNTPNENKTKDIKWGNK